MVYHSVNGADAQVIRVRRLVWGERARIAKRQDNGQPFVPPAWLQHDVV